MLRAHVYCARRLARETTGFLSRDKTFANFAFLRRFAKFSPRKSIFKQLDTALVGVMHWVTANSRKFSPRNSRFVPKRESFLPRKFSAIR